MVKSRGSKGRVFGVHKPTGQVHTRVQRVGPDRFGIVAFDCAKARSKFFLATFYGDVLIPPTECAHSQGDLQAAIDRIRDVVRTRPLDDLIVAIEQTGAYHRPVQEAFRRARFDTRLVHPYASRHYRLPADPGNKTDDTDLAGIFRAAVNGFGLLQPTWPDDYLQLQAIVRHRRDLVRKNARLRCQIQEVLHSLMPGYAACFEDIFATQAPLTLARRTGNAAALLAAGREGLRTLLKQANVPVRAPTLIKVLAWASNAPPVHGPLPQRRIILDNLDDDRLLKNQQISQAEQRAAHLLVGMPYLLLLALPGINVVSAAELAGELGPITLYANANRITGRAGLMPSRYQSDRVDLSSGPLRPAAHRRLRYALLQIADNLVRCNHHFQVRALAWRQHDKDERWIRVKVAKTFSRLAYAMVAGQQIYRHPACQPRHYILDKLLAFHQEHDTPVQAMMRDLDAATKQLPGAARAKEAKPLRQRLEEAQHSRGRGPQLLRDILPLVLAKLGVGSVQSEPAEDTGPS
jgi:transposase